jgi:transcriptional regulator with XRE-family HTH domain
METAARTRRVVSPGSHGQKSAPPGGHWHGSEALGAQLRLAREQQGITLRAFAREVGVSASLVSQIENGYVTPSVGTLFAFCTRLGLVVDDLFKGVERANGEASLENGSLAPSRARSPVQRGTSRKRIRLAGGVRWERLTPEPDDEIEFIHVVYEVGGESCPEDSLVRHGGREYVCILSGRLALQLGLDTYELDPGDSVTFDSQEPHRFSAIGDEPAVAIWVIVNRSEEERRRGWTRIAKTSLLPGGKG